MKKNAVRVFGLLSLRQEILITPVLIFVPILVACLFLYNAVRSGLLYGDSTYFSDFLIGVVILIGNLTFAIPFLSAFFNLRKR
ncbi:MAG TPA: hypothetical protein EYP23_05900 [Thermoplasmata archaeon]|nr:hypothetical protein [Thermoplasmata archaeon]